MTTTDRGDLYRQAIELYERMTGRRALGAAGAIVDLVLDARQPWEVLREAAEVVSRVEMQTEYIRARIEWLTETADVLEAEHQAAQEKAAAEAEREKLIEQVAVAIEAMPREGMSDNGPWADTYGI